jgi:prepilin-type N-terminal cleavage/methylation domain-containing protein
MTPFAEYTIQSPPPAKTALKAGFTLIELAMVLVIIGLLVGGVLVGQDLIRAAGERGQIAQIEKYNQAVNTFRGKYNDQLPGDMDAANAATFGFATRGLCAGEGDGNGVIEGHYQAACGSNGGGYQAGETLMFWRDLSQAELIDGSFSAVTSTGFPASTLVATNPSVSAYLPQGKIGQGQYVYVYSSSGDPNGSSNGSGGSGTIAHYFGLIGVSSLGASGAATMSTTFTLPVIQAYHIDAKMDDGLPSSGNVSPVYGTALYIYWDGASVTYWNNGSAPNHYPTTNATPSSTTTCYDNGNVNGAAMQYSITENHGTGANCTLSFKFQ